MKTYFRHHVYMLLWVAVLRDSVALGGCGWSHTHTHITFFLVFNTPSGCWFLFLIIWLHYICERSCAHIFLGEICVNKFHREERLRETSITTFDDLARKSRDEAESEERKKKHINKQIYIRHQKWGEEGVWRGGVNKLCFVVSYCWIMHALGL